MAGKDKMSLFVEEAGDYSPAMLNVYLMTMGLTEELFKWYCDKFVVKWKTRFIASSFEREVYNNKPESDGKPAIEPIWRNWKTVKGSPLSVGHIALHLIHDVIVGANRVGSDDLIPYFMIDLDNKKAAENSPIEDRYELICKAFPLQRTVFYSSLSEGYHVYFFLKEPIQQGLLRKLVENRLKSFGTEFQNGLIEFFPSISNHFRLPLGFGSAIVHPDTLEHMPTILQPDALRWIQERFMEHDPGSIFSESEFLLAAHELEHIPTETIPQTPKPRKTRKDAGPKNKIPKVQIGAKPSGPISPECVEVFTWPVDQEYQGRDFELFCNCYWEHGLHKPSTRNKVEMKLIAHCFFNGLSDTEADQKLHDWIDRKHNGYSEEYIKNPVQLKKEMSSRVRLLYAKNRERGNKPGQHREAQITVEDLQFICDEEKGLRYSEVEFLYHLLTYLKGRIRPDNLIVPLHVNTLKAMPGCSSRTLSSRKALAEKLGIIRLAKKHVADKHATKYEVTYCFSKGQEIETLEDGLRLLYPSRKPLRKRFSNTLANRVYKEP